MANNGIGMGAITYGFDHNFFNKITVSNGSFNTNADLFIPFVTYTVSFQLESGSLVQYSFNGSTIHGDLTSGKASASLIFENRVIGKIWFQGTGLVRVEAWAVR